MRPGHADFTATQKYHGYADYRGGGHFSGRITTPLVAAGALLIDALKKKGILIGTHIKQCGVICDRSFETLEQDIQEVNEKLVEDRKKKEIKDLEKLSTK